MNLDLTTRLAELERNDEFAVMPITNELRLLYVQSIQCIASSARVEEDPARNERIQKE